MKLKLTALAWLRRCPSRAQAQTEIQWWHSMTGGLNDWVLDLANDFNSSQKEYKIVPTYKGTYDESMPAAVAAFRAGNAPHILQVFEVGTATMMAAKGAMVPVGKVLADAGYKFDPKAYIPAVVGYYTAPNGQMLSFPLQQLDDRLQLQQGPVHAKRAWTPTSHPATWPEVVLAAAKLKASGVSCPFTTSWQGWTQLESFSTWHNTLFATKNNGFGGTSARLVVNSPLHVRHIENLSNMAKQGLFVYRGRGNKADAAVLFGRMRHGNGILIHLRQHQEERQVRFWHCPTALLPRRRWCATKHRDWRRLAVGHGWQEAGGVQGRG